MAARSAEHMVREMSPADFSSFTGVLRRMLVEILHPCLGVDPVESGAGVDLPTGLVQELGRPGKELLEELGWNDNESGGLSLPREVVTEAYLAQLQGVLPPTASIPDGPQQGETPVRGSQGVYLRGDGRYNAWVLRAPDPDGWRRFTFIGYSASREGAERLYDEYLGGADNRFDRTYHRLNRPHAEGVDRQPGGAAVTRSRSAAAAAGERPPSPATKPSAPTTELLPDPADGVSSGAVGVEEGSSSAHALLGPVEAAGLAAEGVFDLLNSEFRGDGAMSKAAAFVGRCYALAVSSDSTDTPADLSVEHGIRAALGPHVRGQKLALLRRLQAGDSPSAEELGQGGIYPIGQEPVGFRAGFESAVYITFVRTDGGVNSAGDWETGGATLSRLVGKLAKGGHPAHYLTTARRVVEHHGGEGRVVQLKVGEGQFPSRPASVQAELAKILGSESGSSIESACGPLRAQLHAAVVEGVGDRVLAQTYGVVFLKKADLAVQQLAEMCFVILLGGFSDDLANARGGRQIPTFNRRPGRAGSGAQLGKDLSLPQYTHLKAALARNGSAWGEVQLSVGRGAADVPVLREVAATLKEIGLGQEAERVGRAISAEAAKGAARLAAQRHSELMAGMREVGDRVGELYERVDAAGARTAEVVAAAFGRAGKDADRRGERVLRDADQREQRGRAAGERTLRTVEHGNAMVVSAVGRLREEQGDHFRQHQQRLARLADSLEQFLEQTPRPAAAAVGSPLGVRVEDAAPRGNKRPPTEKGTTPPPPKKLLREQRSLGQAMSGGSSGSNGSSGLGSSLAASSTSSGARSYGPAAPSLRPQRPVGLAPPAPVRPQRPVGSAPAPVRPRTHAFVGVRPRRPVGLGGPPAPEPGAAPREDVENRPAHSAHVGAPPTPLLVSPS